MRQIRSGYLLIALIIGVSQGLATEYFQFTETGRYELINLGEVYLSGEQLEEGKCLHTKVHTLLLCYEAQWKELRYVKRRESPTIQHYSQYDERAGNWSESK